MATVYPAARNLCAAATYTVRCPQNIGTKISTTTATVAALGRGLWAVGCSTNPQAAATRTLARRRASRSSFTRPCLYEVELLAELERPSLYREADS
eukprot:scaffold117645_cov39-Phaeocystis_antarctica.AAC.1